MGKPFKRDWEARIVFPQDYNFRRPLHPLLLRYTAEIKNLPNFNMFFEFLLKSFFIASLPNPSVRKRSKAPHGVALVF